MKVKMIMISVLILVIAAVTALLLTNNNKITISFNTDGGNSINSITIKKGESITLPNAEKKGFQLDGWYLDNQKVTNSTTYSQNTTLKAKWIPEVKTFTVSFDSDGGTAVNRIQVECGKELSLPENPTKNGYQFVSWVDKNETPILDQALLYCEDITLKAKWEEKNTFTVSFDSDGGTTVNRIQVECGKELSLPENPTKNGYQFVSWVDKNETPILDQALLYCEDITLKAKWEEQ